MQLAEPPRPRPQRASTRQPSAGPLQKAFSGVPGAGEASQIDRWLDSIGMGACKREVAAAGIYKLIDLANITPGEARQLLPTTDAKTRAKLFTRLEEIEIPDD